MVAVHRNFSYENGNKNKGDLVEIVSVELGMCYGKEGLVVLQLVIGSSRSEGRKAIRWAVSYL